ncbi:TIGR03986 family CRISPR-associated RAMP protein [Solwaraspora sp. WMMD406]|uniref:TIGR03986 family type III CRISPR-associated RAMP protein n=1 Tax=Solwaraspora sp. WMMD406 TaxID=3016095 RepID=UPI002417C630|nr:TIGR03986 family CRISPR-associated RAMP protein [Solwaraspora sp. WMMD406]MDG4765298.1 TIGR03986 family CRISPR-associated RAMP protein [Solwaraspora sp. WMMD406]
MSDQRPPVDADGPQELRPAERSFLNPYGFVPIPDRAGLPEPLRDGPPAGHDRYDAARWSGTIAVRITTRTPMLIPDHGRRAADGDGPDAPLPVRVDHAGRPVLAGSAVKGALRSAFEAVTNSRFGVFTGHDQQLAIRATADTSALQLCPAVVDEVGDGTVRLQVIRKLQPTSHEGERVHPAAWLPRRLACHRPGGCQGRTRHDEGPNPPRCSERRGLEVDAWIYLARHHRRNFLFWRVAAYAEVREQVDGDRAVRARAWAERARDRAEQTRSRDSQHIAGQPLVRVRGVVHWTGSTFPAGGRGKHDERLFVTDLLDDDGSVELEDSFVKVDESLVAGWAAVVDSYDHAHDTEAHREELYGGYVWDVKRWRTLHLWDTLYVEFDEGDNPRGLYPAMIGRKPFPGAPVTSLPVSHRPATDRTLLSPADRVFGWVRQGREDDSRVAHRGHLRVLPPEGDDAPGADSVYRLQRPLTLVTLNAPKPSQFLFYLGDRNGGPLGNPRRHPAEGFPAAEDVRRLRGRKTYLTHAEVLDDAEGAQAYWTPPAEATDPPQRPRVGGRPRYREYAAPAGAKPDVSTVVSSWVKPGSTFRLTLQVDNLSRVELAALLWLLSLPDGACLKLGLGKPLGFGAVRVEVDWADTRLFTGDRLLDRCRTLSLSPAADDTDTPRRLATLYDGMLTQRMPEVRDGFLNTAYGFVGVPVHYPRYAATGPDQEAQSAPRGTTYDWWVANDKIGNQRDSRRGRRLSLGSAADPDSLPLPYDPTTEPPANRRTGGYGYRGGPGNRRR